MNEELQNAITSLEVSDVYLRDLRAQLSEGFDPKYDVQGEELVSQFRHVVTHSEVVATDGQEHDDFDPEVMIFRVFVQLGVRWLIPGSAEDEANVVATIESEFIAEYAMHSFPGDDALKEFSYQNASFHIWPYWRELLMNQCVRMNLPRLALPMMQLAENRFRAPSNSRPDDY